MFHIGSAFLAADPKMEDILSNTKPSKTANFSCKSSATGPSSHIAILKLFAAEIFSRLTTPRVLSSYTDLINRPQK